MATLNKKKSKRMTTKLRAKIVKKVAEHKRKQKRAAKKAPNSAKRKRKDPGIPNSLPFKETILKEAEERRQRLEDERQKQKERRKSDREKLVAKKRSLDGMVTDALKKTSAYDRKKEFLSQTTGEDKHKTKKVESSLKTFYKEFRKVVDAADVVLEVLDARDPLGSRCHAMEQAILATGSDKRLVLLLNKIDLVPKENVEAWLAYLKNEFPAIAFKASTQTQNDHLCRTKAKLSKINDDLLKSSHCLGADVLMKLLGNYCRNRGLKTSIRVGVVGFPNTGKSSIVNSLKRSKTCNVGATPGVTKQMQTVQLDKHIRLLDSPGVVMATGTSDTSVILRNCVKLETLDDPTEAVQAILNRCTKQQMMLHYCLPEYRDVGEFLSLLAKRLGRYRKRGVPDVNKAARTVLQDWTSGKITYYTHPPEVDASTHVSAEIVTQIGKEFDMDSLLSDEKKVIDNLECKSTKHLLVESLGPADIVMKMDDINKMSVETKGQQDQSDSDDEDKDEEEGVDNDEEMSDAGDAGEEKMEEDTDEMGNVTVSLSTSASRSRKSSKSSSKDAIKSNSDQLKAGLPQLNKARKQDFKKMKKQRRRRDKVAGELSNALTSAVSLGDSKVGDDDYDFAANFT